MSNKDTAFFKGNKAVFVDFEAEEISSGGLILLEKIECKHQLIRHFSNTLVDLRHPSYIKHTLHKLLVHRVLLVMQGYQDANDADLLKNDPINELPHCKQTGYQSSS